MAESDPKGILFVVFIVVREQPTSSGDELVAIFVQTYEYN